MNNFKESINNIKYMVQYGFIKNNYIPNMIIHKYYLNILGTTIIRSANIVPIIY